MICCVTGHRPSGFPFSQESAYTAYHRLLRYTVKQLIDEGYDHFITGMATGVDTDFAYCILSFQDGGAPVTLEAALPYPLPKRQKAATREAILSRCDTVTSVSPYYHGGCMDKRNRYMVDRADLVLAVWNGTKHGGTWNTIQYARKKGKTIRFILLQEIEQG